MAITPTTHSLIWLILALMFVGCVESEVESEVDRLRRINGEQRASINNLQVEKNRTQTQLNITRQTHKQLREDHSTLEESYTDLQKELKIQKAITETVSQDSTLRQNALDSLNAKRSTLEDAIGIISDPDPPRSTIVDKNLEVVAAWFVRVLIIICFVVMGYYIVIGISIADWNSSKKGLSVGGKRLMSVLLALLVYFGSTAIGKPMPVLMFDGLSTIFPDAVGTGFAGTLFAGVGVGVGWFVQKSVENKLEKGIRLSLIMGVIALCLFVESIMFTFTSGTVDVLLKTNLTFVVGILLYFTLIMIEETGPDDQEQGEKTASTAALGLPRWLRRLMPGKKSVQNV